MPAEWCATTTQHPTTSTSSLSFTCSRYLGNRHPTPERKDEHLLYCRVFVPLPSKRRGDLVLLQSSACDLTSRPLVGSSHASCPLSRRHCSQIWWLKQSPVAYSFLEGRDKERDNRWHSSTRSSRSGWPTRCCGVLHRPRYCEPLYSVVMSKAG